MNNYCQAGIQTLDSRHTCRKQILRSNWFYWVTNWIQFPSNPTALQIYADVHWVISTECQNGTNQAINPRVILKKIKLYWIELKDNEHNSNKIKSNKINEKRVICKKKKKCSASSKLHKARVSLSNPQLCLFQKFRNYHRLNKRMCRVSLSEVRSWRLFAAFLFPGTVTQCRTDALFFFPQPLLRLNWSPLKTYQPFKGTRL